MDPVAGEVFAAVEPGGRLDGGGLASGTVLGALDVRIFAQNAGLHKRPDVHPDAVVEVGVPANRLLMQWLLARKGTVRRPAGHNEFQLLLQERNKRICITAWIEDHNLRILRCLSLLSHFRQNRTELHGLQIAQTAQTYETIQNVPISCAIRPAIDDWHGADMMPVKGLPSSPLS